MRPFCKNNNNDTTADVVYYKCEYGIEIIEYNIPFQSEWQYYPGH